MGLHRAGFDVVGVDTVKQPRYPFPFVQGDALMPPLDLSRFDLVWASPPCQAFTAYRRRPNHVARCPDLIPAARAILERCAAKTVIENVPGAPLADPITLCGSMFGLDVRRHRLFECNFPIPGPACNHAVQLPRFPQASNRVNKRRTVEIGVWRIPLKTQQQAMDISWMQLSELSEAVPPAYSEFIGNWALKHLN